MTDLTFEKGYFKDSEVSNYEDYMQRKHDHLADDIIAEVKLLPSEKVIDFGAATGSLIKELIARGHKEVYGTDISYWAVSYGKEKLGLNNHIQYYNLELLNDDKDYVIALDVLEHIPTEKELDLIVGRIANSLHKGLVLRVPVSKNEGENFFLEVSRNDKTHFQCHSADWWIGYLGSKGLFFDKHFTSKSIYSSDGVLAGLFKTRS